MPSIEVKNVWQTQYLHDAITEDIDATIYDWRNFIAIKGEEIIRIEYDNLIFLAVQTARLLDLKYEEPSEYPDGKPRRRNNDISRKNYESST